MSVQMSVARTFLRVVRKPRDTRSDYEKQQQQNAPLPQPKIAKRHAVEVVEIQGARAVWLRRATSADSETSGTGASARTLGTVVYLHGGSYITGPHAEQWEWASWLVDNANVDMLVVDYKLAPQHPFPEGSDDTLRIVRSLQDDGTLTNNPWVLAGDSAGGGMALATIHALRDEARPLPNGMLLLSPWVDLRPERTYDNAAQDPWLTVAGLKSSAQVYAHEHGLYNIAVSPLANNQRGLPPTYIDAATDDILLGEGRDLRDAIVAAGGSVSYYELVHGFHDYPLVGFIPEARQARRRQAAWLKSVLAR